MNNKINVEVKTKEQRDELIKQLQEMEFKKELPKKWEDLKELKGYFVSGHSQIALADTSFIRTDNENIYKTHKQAQSALAKAQLSQLMYIYNDGWEPDWNEYDEVKYTLRRVGGRIERGLNGCAYSFLSFKTEEIRDEFYNNFEYLIKQYYEL